MNLSWSELAEGFAVQAAYCKDYSPLYEAIFQHFTSIAEARANHEPLEFDAQPLVDLLETEWANRQLQNTVESSLLLTAAIHAAVLNEDTEAAGLSRFYASVGGEYAPDYDREVLLQTLGGLLLRPSQTVRDFLRGGGLQTNEVSRGAMWLLPAIAMSANMLDMPITLVDLGCSAGLNLAADAQSWLWLSAGSTRQFGSGDPLVTQQLDFGDTSSRVRKALAVDNLARPHIVQRLGFDLNPLHLDKAHDVLWLRACIWGDQAARLARFDQALVGYQGVQPPPHIEAANMIDAARTLHTRLTPETRVLLVYNTIATLYLNDADYAALRSSIVETFAQLPDSVTGIWLEHEPTRVDEPPVPPKLYALKVHTLLDNDTLNTRYIAYTEAHPQTIVLLPDFEILLT